MQNSIFILKLQNISAKILLHGELFEYVHKRHSSLNSWALELPQLTGLLVFSQSKNSFDPALNRVLDFLDVCMCIDGIISLLLFSYLRSR